MGTAGRDRIPKKPLLGLALLLLAVAMTWSCAPDSGFNTISDYDVVVTRYADSGKFGTYQTYSMPDSVVQLYDPDKDPPDPLDPALENLILSTVASNMQKYGYTREMDPESNTPDVFVYCEVTTTTWIGYSYYPWYGYWGWYPGWGWGGGYYPWYPGGTWTSYTFDTGTVIINYVDVEQSDPDTETFAVVWWGGMNGLLGDTSSSGMARVERGIDQAFTQSPYLKVK